MEWYDAFLVAGREAFRQDYEWSAELKHSPTTVLSYLNSLGIEFIEVTHPPVFTCEEARQHVPPLPGVETKNLFLRDAKGKRHFLLTVAADKSVDLRRLSEVMEVKGLGFASPERLEKYLQVQPGSVSLLAVINDSERVVEVLIDEDLAAADAFQCHPLVNTSTISLSKEHLFQFFSAIGLDVRHQHVPQKSELTTD